MGQQQKAYLYALSAILLWSTIGSALKLTLDYISFAELLFYASATSVLVLLGALWTGGKLHKLKSLKKHDLIRAAILGLINPFLYYLVLLKAYDLLLAQEAGTLNYIWPVVLVLLSIPLLGQHIGWLSILAVLISFAGTVIIGTRGEIFSLSFSNPLGTGLALVSAVFWALYWIYNMKDKKEEVVKLFLNFCFGVFYTLIYLLITNSFKPLNTPGLLGSVYAGFFEMGITYILWLKALQLSQTTARVSNLVFLSPFISLIFIRYAVGEHIMLSTVAGLFLIVGGILLQRFAGSMEKSSPSS
ncbi:MAG: DMT family transporter [Bacteroidales bacterium]